VRLPPAQSAADAGALGGGDTAGAGDAASADPPYEYKPFARLRERNPHRCAAPLDTQLLVFAAAAAGGVVQRCCMRRGQTARVCASCTHTPRTHRCTRRLLGVSKEASFEEIQDARNYLFEVCSCCCCCCCGYCCCCCCYCCCCCCCGYC
jgi:hypothetical protein